jgi:glutamine synthetase
MGRARHNVFAQTNSPHYVVTWDPQWRIIDCLRPSPGSDPRAAFAAAIARLEHDGWTAQSGAEFGFAFLRRGAERRLVTITGRDPFDSAAQSFSPF